jgi:hypothetical protein
MAIQYLMNKNLPIVEYKDNLLLFSSHSTFNIIHITLYISLYFIYIKKIICGLFVLLVAH